MEAQPRETNLANWDDFSFYGRREEATGSGSYGNSAKMLMEFIGVPL